VTLEAPPLRERKEDIPALAEHFLAGACADNNLAVKKITPQAMERLAAHDYPGNVRELRNIVERLVILTPGETIGPREVEEGLPSDRTSATGAPGLSGSLKETMTELERQVVLKTLEKHGWRMAASARELGLERSHLYKKLKLLGIEKPQ
jgi:two-component system nitrogen regulation response regulator NtrX